VRGERCRDVLLLELYALKEVLFLDEDAARAAALLLLRLLLERV
jgi:hypothetical protein